MSYFVDKITTLKIEASEEIYFMELDKKNFPEIYIKGIRNSLGINTKLHLFHNTKKENVYSFPEGCDICFLDDLLPPIYDNKLNRKHHYNLNINSMNDKTRIANGKTYIYCPETQIFIFPEIYDCQKKMRLNYYEVKNQNYNFTLNNINTENIIETGDSHLGINAIKLPKSNKIMLKVGTKIIFININNNTTIIKTWDYKNINIQSIILDNYISINMINNNTTWNCILYDYQNNEEVINKEGFIINKNDDVSSNYWLQDESIIIIQNKDEREILKLRDVDELPDEQKCVVCFQMTDRKSALVPCGHTQFCSNCISKFTSCPVCRADVSTYIKIF